MTEKVAAVVVTYNRKAILAECVQAVLNQTFSVENLLIVDNHSTDQTEEYLRQEGFLAEKKVRLLTLPENMGGAGGFYEGMKAARAYAPDWIWIMDDDVIPAPDCLEELIKASRIVPRNTSFLASAVRGLHGEAMNVPKITRKQYMAYTDWYRYLDEGIVQIVKATFVSLLINIHAVEACGLPWKEFFIWGDDSEYTQRIIRDYGPAYMAGKSAALHKRASADALSIVTEEDKNRIGLYYYYYRNNLIGFWEYETRVYRFLCMGKLWYDFMLVLLKGRHKCRKIKVILSAFFAFVFGSYDRKAFRNRARL